MMLKPRKNILIYRFFEHYVILKIKKRFSRVLLSGEIRDDRKPILLVANHNSWWDGLWASYVNTTLFGRKFHFIRNTGAYSVRKGSRDAYESFQYTLQLLRDPGNLVLLFPQGKLESLYVREFTFEKGADTIVRRVGEQIRVVMMATMVDYFSHVKPGLYIYLREYLPGSGETLEEAYNRFYAESLQAQTERRDE